MAYKRKKRYARVLKASKHQSGQSSTKHDKRYPALKPGKRKSKSGKVYYEDRRNRSDKNKKTRL